MNDRQRVSLEFGETGGIALLLILLLLASWDIKSGLGRIIDLLESQAVVEGVK